MSRTQVDRLGERLRGGSVGEADLRALDDYRLSFRDAYVYVASTIDRLGHSFWGRPQKSTTSIRQKLQRESVRLSQIQDIAGCRFLVVSRDEQDEVARKLGDELKGAELVDRRARPSHGYRAVHLIATHGGRPVEIQVRTAWQHHWADTSEKVADRVGFGVKYGLGPPEVEAELLAWSEAIARWEEWLQNQRVDSDTLVSQTQAENHHQRARAGHALVTAAVERVEHRDRRR